MLKSEIITQGKEMNDENINYFLIGLKSAIRRSGLTQKEFSEGVTSEENLSKILNRRVGTTPEMRESLARKAGMDVTDIVLYGKQIKPVEAKVVEEQPAFHMDPLDMLAAVASEYRKADNDAAYWKSIPDSLSIAVSIVDIDGSILYQNQADRSLHQKETVGEAICHICRSSGNNHENCAVKNAIEIGEQQERHVVIKERFYRILANPVQTPEGRRIIVLAIPADELKECLDERDILKQQIYFLLKNAKMPLFFEDQGGVITHVTEEIYDLFKIKRDDIRTNSDFLTILAQNIKEPATAINLMKSISEKKEQEQLQVEFLSGSTYTMFAQPAFGIENQLIGVLVKFFKDYRDRRRQQ